ncbi:MAG TPA: hypothetical protein VI688_01490 [Anaerolineales bacterium]|nr:hypothetical protein [Anaerolineales bacterium]
MFIKIPRPAKVVARLEPPKLTSGSVLPAKGTRPTITAMLMEASSVIHSVMPAASKEPNISGARRAMSMPRHKMRPKINSVSKTPISPSSSPMTAKMLSVGGTGRPVSLVSDWPRPTPNQPPCTKAS